MMQRLKNIHIMGLILCTLLLFSQTIHSQPTETRSLFQQIDKNKKRHLNFLQQLIQTQKQGEEAVQALVARRFKKLGCEVETLKILPATLSMKHQFAAKESIPEVKRISVVAKYPGTGSGRSLLLFAHPDGEDTTNTEAWTRDPFGGEVERDKIYGWGVADDLAGVAAMAEALDALLQNGVRPQGDVILCSTPAKKNAQGVIALLSHGIHADASVYLHPAESGVGMREIKAIASGLMRFRITVTGKQPDTSEPGKTAFAHQGVNAVDKATQITAALKKLNEERGERIHHPKIHAAVGRSTNILIGHLNGGNPEGFTQVPEQCVIGASITFPPGEKLSEIQSQIQTCITEAAQKDEWLSAHPPVIEWLFGTQGVEVSDTHPLYLTVSDAITQVTGESPFVNPLHSASDIRNPILFSNIPTVGYGPLGGDLSQNGHHDEWVRVSDFMRSIKVTAYTISQWCR